MSEEPRSLLKAFGRAKRRIVGWLPFLGRPSATSDPVADRLKDLNWVETEDEETARRQTADQAVKGDGLATTVYNARPQNPFSKDF